jgi:peroxiredoxin
MKRRLPASLVGVTLCVLAAVSVQARSKRWSGSAGSSAVLTLGATAPDIVGTDLDGRALRLSDYRGKVVVVTFSGEWCGICRSEYPYHRFLLELYRDWPFALLSVESGADRDVARRAKIDRGLLYRSWWDGAPRRDAPGTIAAAWGVSGWPTTYVLDEKGAIRAIDPRKEDLLKVVRQLLTGQP